METLTMAARIRRLSTALVLAAVVAGGAGLAAARPAFADEHDWHRDRVEQEHRERVEHARREAEHERREHAAERERWEHGRYVPARPVYAPPPVVYVPPAPPPGINFSLNIR